MPAWILKLMPWRDWAYLGAAVAAIVFYNVHVHNLVVAGQKAQVVAIAAASAKVQAAADAEMARVTADYHDKLIATEKTYAQNILDNGAAHAADLKRLQQLANSYRDANKALHSALGSEGKPDTGGGAGSAEGVGQLSEFASVSLGLADALRGDDALLTTCRADRDALTGK